MKSFLLVCLAIVACQSLKPTIPGSKYSGEFKITRIDSTGNYYLLYASRNDSTFKKISKKEETIRGCEPIALNHDYKLTMQSAMPDIRVGKGVYSATKNLHVDCYGFNSETTICFEKGCIRDLFYSLELQGVCYSAQ